MEDVITFFGETLLGEELLPEELVSAVAFLVIGLKLYSGTKEPTDEWDRFLRNLGLVLTTLGAIGILIGLSQLI